MPNIKYKLNTVKVIVTFVWVGL